MSFLFKLNRYILEFYCEFKRQLRLQKIQKLSAVLDGLLNAKSGVEGELALIRGVKNALTELNVNHITHIDYGLKDAVLVFKNNTSYEYDLIVLTEIGLYVFEAKNWWGEVKLSNQSGKLELNQFQKGTFLRSDPSETNHKKMRALVKPISQSIYCFAPVVFTNLETKLDSNIPNHILHINNLGSFFEQEFEAAKRSNREKLSVQDLSKEIFCQLDHDLRAKHFHMMRMPETEENSVKLYHETQAKIDELEKSIAEIKVADYTITRIFQEFVVLVLNSFKKLFKNKTFLVIFIWFAAINLNMCLRHIINILKIKSPVVLGFYHAVNSLMGYTFVALVVWLFAIGFWKLLKFYWRIKLSK
jgi:hypothetical protein